jgi:hypothetical protein
VDRIFLDANVLFSAAYGSAGLRTLWDLIRAGRCELLASSHVIEEARRNLSPQHLLTFQKLERDLKVVPAPAQDVPCPIELPAGDREAFLAALAAGASHFLTGDVGHFGHSFGATVAVVLIQPPGNYLASRKARRK